MIMGKTRILIVEDEAIVAHDLRITLESYGCVITGIAMTGNDAIDQATQNPPDLVLMDIRIPGDLNGMETAIILERKLAKPIPVIFLTALSLREFPALRRAGSFVYLNKPFTEGELVQTIEGVTGQAICGS
jgi:CheY-like chemotaxis protein